jgi:hypothetical protein
MHHETAVRTSERDQIDLCSDGDSVKQSRRSQNEDLKNFSEFVNVDFHPSRLTPGAYPRKKKQLKPYSAYSGIKSVSQQSEDFRKAICDGDGLSIVILASGLRLHWAHGLRGWSFIATRFANEKKLS